MCTHPIRTRFVAGVGSPGRDGGGVMMIRTWLSNAKSRGFVMVGSSLARIHARCGSSRAMRCYSKHAHAHVRTCPRRKLASGRGYQDGFLPALHRSGGQELLEGDEKPFLHKADAVWIVCST
jgi:hypothetical protein